MRDIVGSIESEFRRYEARGKGALAQVEDAELSLPGPAGSHSIATLVWHTCGFLHSRFTDFLTTDGEKPWRHREREFEARHASRDELIAKWEQGWATTFAALGELSDSHLTEIVTIRSEQLPMHDALHRALGHTCYHVGQLIYLARSYRGEDWQYLSANSAGSQG